MKKLLPLVFLMLMYACQGQDHPDELTSDRQESSAEATTAIEAPAYAGPLYDAHEQYLAPSITHRRFKHQDIEPILLQLQPPFRKIKVGASIEDRSIYHISWGEGPVPVLLWSQMHGDEPTATMALMDIFNFLAASDEFDDLRSRLADSLTIHFIPLLNPDGAEKYERRNALGVDLNRDALRLQCPESKILKNIRDEIQAEWGFNLHDQSRYYAAGRTGGTASVSFLAPAYNYEKEVDEKRADAMQLIVLLNDLLQGYIPDRVARYDDAFEPRAFGDNMQKWGTRTILVESGGLPGDREKQELRRLHFVLLLTALDAIASQSYEKAMVEAYDQIPMNNSAAYFDLLLREVEVQRNDEWYTVDLGFRRVEVDYDDDPDDYYPRGRISEIGDLSTFWGYEELDAKGYRAIPGQLHPRTFANLNELKKENVLALIQQGYTAFHLSAMPSAAVKADLPVEVVSDPKRYYNEIGLYGNPSLILKKGGETDYVVANGRLVSLKAGALW